MTPPQSDYDKNTENLALEHYANGNPIDWATAKEAIAKIKEEGNWPLEDKP